MSNTSADVSLETLPDLIGTNYYRILEQCHKMLVPNSYLEIGVNSGRSLALSRCASIGIDPGFAIADPAILADILRKPKCMFFNTGSDEFFSIHRPHELLGRSVDFAFLDGMHRCEYLLRDFANTEEHCKQNSVIALHDCLPTDEGMTGRVPGQWRSPLTHRSEWWTGDVWRTSLLLKRRRPDLKMTVLDASPTGLVLVTNLNPTDRSLKVNYADYVEEMLSWSLGKIGVSALFDEMNVESTSAIETHERFTGRFWL